MNARQVGSIVAKALAVYSVFRAIGLAAHWTQGIYTLQRVGELGFFWRTHYAIDIILFAAYLFVAMVLWANAHRFGVVKGEVETADQPEPLDWKRVAFSILGVFIALTYLSSVLNFILFLGMATQERSRWVEYAPNIVTFAIGLGMWLHYGVEKKNLQSAANWPRPPSE